MKIMQPAEVSPYNFGGWGLAFWVGNLFEEEANSTLCRAATAELVDLLARHAPVKLTLPPPRHLEIVVEESLSWGDVKYAFGFNTSDGVVGVNHHQREPLDRLLSAVEDGLIVTSGR